MHCHNMYSLFSQVLLIELQEILRNKIEPAQLKSLVTQLGVLMHCHKCLSEI